ncbi:uncharacterized protein LOC126894929 [Daktulosphaira vitifoliae]|uniref:uncharacterized protein LOC126894929 n=1 Tax=Daktulosphaira vitifoliae TaxID=58002 RepID=UPI0021AA6CFD|nr:uncharacterized protein LOC126894929 [Daktulosphaira vitifoliae]
MNDLSDVFQHSSYLCFADDVKIYSNIRTIHDSHNLQADLCRFYNWCVVNGLCLNVSKCAQITFCRKRSYELYAYNINSINLINVPHIKDLGVILSSNLSFTEHISFIYNKALRMLGFLKRNCWEFSNPICLKVLYCSLVRSIVEYGSIIWSPYQANLTNKLEKLLKRFLRMLVVKVGKYDINEVDLNVVASNITSLSMRRKMFDVS